MIPFRIANAGIAQVKPLLDLTEADFETMFRVNVFGVQNCYQAAAKQMIKQGNCSPSSPGRSPITLPHTSGTNQPPLLLGKLIGCSSIVGFKPFALLSHYSASKWAVRGLTQAYAMEMAEYNITVNAYAPGIVGTQMWDLIDEKLGEKTGAKKGDTIKKYLGELIALKRTSTPEDVAKLVSFLGGPDSDYVTVSEFLLSLVALENGMLMSMDRGKRRLLMGGSFSRKGLEGSVN